jgi:hypothetical protein
MKTTSRKLACSSFPVCATDPKLTFKACAKPVSVLVVMLLQLAACGGGSPGNSGPPPPPPVTASFTVTPNTVTMTAPSVIWPGPIGPFVTGTVTGTVTGVLYINIVVSGPAVLSIGSLNVGAGSNSGTAQILPQFPWALGAGTFTSTVTIHACQGDQTCRTGELMGSPQVVNVTYTIPSSLGNIPNINPFEVASGVSGDVVMRSSAFVSMTAPSSVSVGSNAAVAFTHPDPTTFTLTYPALPAGSYPITTNNHDSLGTLTVVDVPAFGAASLPYPATPGGVSDVVYDADLQALIVTTRNADSSTNQLLSYGYSNGVWSAPAATTVPGLRHLVPVVNWSSTPLSHDYMLVSEGSITYYHAGYTPPPVFGPDILTGVAYSNADYYVITHEDTSSTTVGIETFEGPGGVILTQRLPTPATAGAFLQPAVAGSADGSRIVILPGSGATAKITSYDSTHELLSDTAVVFNHNGTGRVPALDRRATRIVVSNDTATNVYDGSFNLLGTLPPSTQAYVLNSAGTRVYTYDGTPQILAFDVSSTANGGAYAPLGAPVPVSSVGTSPRMSISLDDRTVFVAGTARAIVRPVP